jgi:hypothetical protein
MISENVCDKHSFQKSAGFSSFDAFLIETAFFESQFFRTDFTWTYSGKTPNENILLRDSQLVEKVLARKFLNELI